MQGGLARYINHSCDPNCYTRIVTVEGKKHIAIFSKRVIAPDEELCYDYKVVTPSSFQALPTSSVGMKACFLQSKWPNCLRKLKGTMRGSYNSKGLLCSGHALVRQCQAKCVYIICSLSMRKTMKLCLATVAQRIAVAA